MIRKIICCIIIILYTVNVMSQVALTHTVKQGESLNSIAQKYGVSTDLLKKANPDMGDYFYVGLVLNIPVKTNLDTINQIDSLETASSEKKDSISSAILDQTIDDNEVSRSNNENFRDDIWKPLSCTIHFGLNVSDLTGNGAKGCNPNVGQILGISMDAFNNKHFGIEGDVLLNRYVYSMKNDSYKATASSLYLELMFLLSGRLFIKKSALEANLGLSYNFGLYSYVKYENKEIPSYSLFKGNKYSDGMIENHSGMFVYGLTFKQKHAQLRLLIHQGLPNISKSESNKIRLWNAEISVGYTI